MFQFCQIGANDSVSGDNYLHKRLAQNNWRGVMVEPLPHVYSQLNMNVAGFPGVVTENCAISAAEGEVTLYYPEDRTMLASVDPNVVLSHGVDAASIKQAAVPCKTLDQLLDAHQLHDLDLLMIDTEGHDLQVLKSLDPQRSSVQLALIEIKHISENDLIQMQDFLTGMNLVSIPMGADLVAIRTNRENKAIVNLIAGIFREFRNMERRNMAQLIKISDLYRDTVARTPRS